MAVRDENGRFTDAFNDDQLLSALQEMQTPNLTSNIADEVDSPKRTVREHLDSLADDEEVERIDLGSVILWDLPDTESLFDEQDREFLESGTTTEELSEDEHWEKIEEQFETVWEDVVLLNQTVSEEQIEELVSCLGIGSVIKNSPTRLFSRIRTTARRKARSQSEF